MAAPLSTRHMFYKFKNRSVILSKFKTGMFEIDPFEEFINTFKFRNKEVLEFHFKISSFVNSTAKWDKYVKTS